MNRLRAHLTCSFRGETYNLDTYIDLDAYAPDPDSPPDFHRALAQAGGVDTYSYLYEALETHDIEFSEAIGLAALCCGDQGFDWPRYVALRQEELELAPLQEIAANLLGVTDLEQRPDLKVALLAAYQAGRRAC